MARKRRKSGGWSELPRESQVFGPTVGATGLGGRTGYASPGAYEPEPKRDDW